MHSSEILGIHRAINPKLDGKDFQAELSSTEIDFEVEFYLVIQSATKRDLSQNFSYVARARRMSRTEKHNFFSLAAETVVACYRNMQNNLHKFCNIQDRLAKTRATVNKNSENENKVLKEIEKLADSVIDIFDY